MDLILTHRVISKKNIKQRQRLCRGEASWQNRREMQEEGRRTKKKPSQRIVQCHRDLCLNLCIFTYTEISTTFRKHVTHHTVDSNRENLSVPGKRRPSAQTTGAAIAVTWELQVFVPALFDSDQL